MQPHHDQPTKPTPAATYAHSQEMAYDTPLNRDDLLWWVAEPTADIVTSEDDMHLLDISHVKHLHSIRQMLPYPT